MVQPQDDSASLDVSDISARCEQKTGKQGPKGKEEVNLGDDNIW